MDQNPSAVAYSRKPRPPEVARFLDLIGAKLAATEEVLQGYLESDVPFIGKAGNYLFNGGGKRIRPALLLLSARTLDRDSDEEITYAAVIELVHTASLVHDDIIDGSKLRRGKATLNHLWGNSLTVLLGDWLYTTAMRMALSHDNLDVIRVLCDAVLKMTEGELLALERQGEADVTVEEYFDITSRKTAQLFTAACSLPSLMYPQRLDLRDDLASYGRSLGTCFQLVDDLLDFTAREEELGKPVLSDLAQGRLTLPLILLLPRVDPSARRLIAQVLEDRAFRRVAPEQILELVAAEGTVEEVAEIAERHAVEAREALGRLPACEARDALEFAPDFVLQRRV